MNTSAQSSPSQSDPSRLQVTTWRDCLHMSPEVAAIVMGVTPTQAADALRTIATRQSRTDRLDEVVGDFKHSALAFVTPGHAPMTQTYRLILNKPVADTYRCKNCGQSQKLHDDGIKTLCLQCHVDIQAKIAQERQERKERKAVEKSR